MQRGPVVNPRGERKIPERIIRLVFDGTSGPMRFQVARADVTMREARPRRDDRSPAIAR
jgi:hypothetical protein